MRKGGGKGNPTKWGSWCVLGVSKKQQRKLVEGNQPGGRKRKKEGEDFPGAEK